jgi:hypothetical protein
VVSTDDAGASGHIQRVKLTVSADGDATHLPGTATDGMLVNLGANNDVVVSDGGSTISVDDGAGSLTVDNAALSVTGGGVEASALRVTLASDSTGVVSVDDNGASLTVDNAALSVTGGGTESGAQRVTIASDSTGVLSVDDNGGSLTVDGTIAATQSGTWNVTNVSGTVSLPTGASTLAEQQTQTTALQLIDNIVQTEDATHSTGHSGVMTLGVRNDAGTALAGTDGDYIPLSMDASGFLRVNVAAGGGSGGTSATDDGAFTAGAGSGTPIMGFATADTVDSGDVGVVAMTTGRALHVHVASGGGTGGTAMADDAAFTPGSTNVTPIAGVFDDTTPDSVNEGDAGAVRMSANRSLYVNIRDNAGNERGLNIDASGQLAVTIASAQTLATVTNVATIGTSVTPGTAAANLGKAVDSAAGGTDTGVAMLAIRDDALTTLTPVDGDYVPLRVSSTGALHVTGAAGTTQYAEDLAHSSGDSLCMSGAVRRDSPAVGSATDGDNSTINVDATGRLWVQTGGGSGTGTLANVAGSATSVTLIASNAARRGFAIFNDSTAILYIHGGGGTASTTSFTWNLLAGESLERFGPCYTGALTGIWASATGNARTTEWT